MPQRLEHLKETPSQTAGPYVHIGLVPKAAGFEIFDHDFAANPASADADGEQITVEGHVFDGAGEAVKDVLLEVWHADASGTYRTAPIGKRPPADGFVGWGRIPSDFDTGLWRFDTIKPGRVNARTGHGLMAPHITFWIVARGINVGLNTRLYFGDEAQANATDPVLQIIEQADRRRTLIAPRAMVDGKPVYRFDIHLQGDRETVFFDI